MLLFSIYIKIREKVKQGIFHITYFSKLFKRGIRQDQKLRFLRAEIGQCIRTEFPKNWESFCRAEANMQETFASIYPSFSTDELPKSLTAREREVALLAASGLTNEEIAGKLSLTVSTVRTHLRSVFRKLNVDRRTKLADKLR